MNDSLLMKSLIDDFSHQLSRCVKISQGIRMVQPANEIRNVVVAGMGSGGIGANLVASLMRDELGVPLIPLKSYEVPGFINKHTLLIAISFSGNTEETLDAVALAHEAGAMIACITSGGKLLSFAQTHSLTLAQVPADIPTPRAAFGYSFVTILYLLKNYDLISEVFELALQEAIWLIDAQRPKMKELAQALAADLHEKLPVVYADDKLHPVLVRFQQQLNENAKHLTHVNVFPEMNHNELVACLKPESVWRNAVIILVKTAYDHPRVTRRLEICEPVFRENAGKVVHLKAIGDSFLEECVYLIHLFDWVSFYLSEKNGVDAFQVANIDHLKKALAS